MHLAARSTKVGRLTRLLNLCILKSTKASLGEAAAGKRAGAALSKFFPTR